MAGEEAVIMVLEYIHRYLSTPRYCGSIGKRAFEQASFSRWAAYEIIDRLSSNPQTPAWSVIDEFVALMDRYSCSELAPLSLRWRYSVAHDMAEEVRSLFI